MKRFFLLMLFVCGMSWGQESLNLTPNGFAPVVTVVEGMSSSDIYSKTKDWIQTYYKNPNEVLKADIKNEMIRIDGFDNNAFQTKSLGIASNMGCSYTLEIEIKEGKYRYNFVIRDLWAGSQKCLYTYRTFFKSDGSIRKVYDISVETMNKSVNDNYLSLYNYITGKTKEVKSDW